jgi:FkbM family methyltransferase
MTTAPIGPIKVLFRRVRRRVIRLWRFNFMVPRLLKYNAYTGFFGRRLFYYFPFFLPHDKSYYGFTHLVHPGDGLFLDVGANDGISAIGFRHIHSDYRILSIEPNRYHEPNLKKLKKKLKQFDYLIVAAGSEPGQKVLHLPFYSGIPVHTAASIRPEFVQSSMKDQFRRFGDEKIAVLQQIVDVVRVDDLNLEPDIIKIDAEGYDYQVLLGCVKTIGQARPYMVVEYNPQLINDIEPFFKSLSYDIFTYDYQRDRFASFQKDAGVRQQSGASKNLFCIPTEKVKDLAVQH